MEEKFKSAVKEYYRNKNVSEIILGGFKFINKENGLTDEIKSCFLNNENDVIFVIENLITNSEYNISFSEINKGSLIVLYGQIVMRARSYKIDKYDTFKLKDGTCIYTIDTLHNNCQYLNEGNLVILDGDKHYRATKVEHFKRLFNDNKNDEVNGNMISVTLKESETK